MNLNRKIKQENNIKYISKFQKPPLESLLQGFKMTHAQILDSFEDVISFSTSRHRTGLSEMEGSKYENKLTNLKISQWY